MTDLQTPYSTRLCLSGLESRRLLETFSDFGVKHIQVSYYYLRRVFAEPTEFEKFITPFTTVLIDSGTVFHKFKTVDEEKSFLGEYASYVGALDKKSYTAAVYEEGVEMDKLISEDMLIYPLDIVRPVFDNDLGALCRNIKYIGVSNKEATAKGGENLIPLIAEAKNHNSKIHLFGTSSKRILNRFPIYSANTSSWRSGSRYLNTYIYEGGSRGLRLYQPTDKSDAAKTERELSMLRRRQQNVIKIKSPALYELINWDEVNEGDAWEVDKANLTQWLDYSTDLESTPHKAYWLSDSEKQSILTEKAAVLSNSSPTAHKEKGEGDIKTHRDIEEDIEGEVIEGDVVEEDKESTIEAHDVTDEVEAIPVLEDGDTVGEFTSANISNDPKDLVRKTIGEGLIPKKDFESQRLTPIDERMRQVRQCDFCILAGRCPKYEPGSPCSFGLSPENPTYDHTELELHVMEDMADLLAIQKDRIQQAALEERMDASGLSKDLGKEMERYIDMVQKLSEATDKREELSIKAKGHGILEMFRKDNK